MKDEIYGGGGRTDEIFGGGRFIENLSDRKYFNISALNLRNKLKTIAEEIQTYRQCHMDSFGNTD